MGNQCELVIKVTKQTQLVNRVESSDFQETYDVYKQGETRIVAFRPDHIEVGVRHSARTDNTLFVDINSEDPILVDQLNSRSDLDPLKVGLSEYEGWDVFGQKESKEIAWNLVRVWRHPDFKENYPELYRSLNSFALNFTPERIEALGAGMGLPHEVTVVHNLYCYILQGIDIAPMTPVKFSFEANSLLAESSFIHRGLRPLDPIDDNHSLVATTQVIE